MLCYRSCQGLLSLFQNYNHFSPPGLAVITSKFEFSMSFIQMFKYQSTDHNFKQFTIVTAVKNTACFRKRFTFHCIGVTVNFKILSYSTEDHSSDSSQISQSLNTPHVIKFSFTFHSTDHNFRQFTNITELNTSMFSRNQIHFSLHWSNFECQTRAFLKFRFQITCSDLYRLFLSVCLLVSLQNCLTISKRGYVSLPWTLLTLVKHVTCHEIANRKLMPKRW